MGMNEVGFNALCKADDILLNCANLEYVCAKTDDNGGVDLNLTQAQSELPGLSDAANKEGAQGGEGFYANIGGDWVKADTIAGGNKVMLYMKGATDITQNQMSVTSKQAEGIKTVQQTYKNQ